jgi:hypothetical protein
MADFNNSKILATGSCVGIVTATECPTVTCDFAAFIADGGNTGYVGIGKDATVTLPGNATVATAGVALGTTTGVRMTPFIPCSNLNNFYYICSSTVDWFTYICLG